MNSYRGYGNVSSEDSRRIVSVFPSGGKPEGCTLCVLYNDRLDGMEPMELIWKKKDSGGFSFISSRG